MSDNILSLDGQNMVPNIAVMGVGGGGCNAVNDLIKKEVKNITFIAANTDLQILSKNGAQKRIQLGKTITKGLGTGGSPEIAKAATEESIEEIKEALKGLNLLFITTGMGGGTGTGATPVIAKIAREMDILTIAIITKPFIHESVERCEIAERGIDELRKYVNTIIILPNENLFKIANQSTTIEEAFSLSNNVLYFGIKGITDLIFEPGLINIDFADVSTAIKKMGKTVIGVGEGEGEDRYAIALEQALSNPLLEDISISGAECVLVNVTGGEDLTLFKHAEIMNEIKSRIGTDKTYVKPGASILRDFQNKIRIIIFATGINTEKHEQKTKKEEPLKGDIFKSENKSVKNNDIKEEVIAELGAIDTKNVSVAADKAKTDNVTIPLKTGIRTPIKDFFEEEKKDDNRGNFIKNLFNRKENESAKEKVFKIKNKNAEVKITKLDVDYGNDLFDGTPAFLRKKNDKQ
ncbi:MAG: cell division protein FtsZ [Rickettsiales bacterium]|jgi:cell division protein FtsZ|nr:cell division protein FtsZ [Rickettsiales bacterium]